MNMLFGKTSQKKVKVNPKPATKQMSVSERNARLERCFQLGLQNLANSEDVYVRNRNGIVWITESPLINESTNHSILYWDAIERNGTTINDMLRQTFKYLYILDKKNRQFDCSDEEMLDHDIEIINQSVEISYNQMIKEGLVEI